MHPELFRIGEFPVRSFGVALMFAVLAAIVLTMRRASRFGLPQDRIADLALWAVLPGLLGARLAYVLQNLDYFGQNPDQLLSLRFDGLTSFGGYFLGALGVLIYSRIAKIRFADLGDLCAPGVVLAAALGRIGCLLNGCCFGHPNEGWFGVHVHGHADRLAPAQIIDMALLIVGLLAMLAIEKRGSKPGQLSFLAAAVYGFSRFVYEFWRAGTPEEAAAGRATSEYIGSLPITSAQVVALAMVAVGLIGFWMLRRGTPRLLETGP